MPIILLLIIFILSFYLFCRKNSKVDKFLWSIPNAFPELPLIGSVLILMFDKNIKKTISDFSTTNKWFRLWIGNKNFLVVDDPELVHEILTNRNTLHRSDFARKVCRPWLGESIMMANPPKWQENRKIIQESFSHEAIIQSFFPIFNEESQILSKSIQNHANDEKVFDVGPFIDAFSLDIITRTAAGVKIDAQTSQSYASVIESIHTALKHMSLRFFYPWLDSEFVFRFSSYYLEHTKTYEIIKAFLNKLKLLKQKDPPTNTLNSGRKEVLLETILRKTHSDDLISENINFMEEFQTIMFAGFETTAIAIKMIIFFLASYPQFQQKVFDEQMRITKKNLTSDNIAYEDLKHMTYLEMFVKETMRRHTLVPFLSRHSGNEFELKNGTIVPKGVNILLAIDIVHNNPKIWPNPFEFDPERFSPTSKIPKNSYFPFGAGLRNCIGSKYAMIEMLTVTALLVRKYKFKTTAKLEDLKMVTEVTQKSSNGYPVILERR